MVLAQASEPVQTGGGIPVQQYWQSTQPDYKGAGRREVSVRSGRTPESAWVAAPDQGTTGPTGVSYVAAPPGSLSPAFDRLEVHDLSGQAGNEPPMATFHIVGEFNPGKLFSFSAASSVPLQIFHSPLVKAADSSTQQVIGASTLGPTTNIAGYVAQPPSLLTTLAAANSFFRDGRYRGSNPRPISAVLVRLSGSLGVSATARGRLEAVAETIRRVTGLRVDVMDGSSPTPIRVNLQEPGRSLQFVESWVRKGVTYEILGSMDSAVVGLLVMTLVVGLTSLGSFAYSVVRRRRREISVLSAVGWTGRDLVWRMALQFALVGVVGAVAGVVATVVTSAATGTSISRPALLWSLLLAPIGTALVSVVPILKITRNTGTLTLPSRRRGALRVSRLRLAIAGLTSSPGRTVAAALALATGVAAAVSELALQNDARAQIFGTNTILGRVANLRLDGLQTATALAVGLVGVAAVTGAVLSGAAERRRNMAVLAASGWTQRDLVLLILAEALTIGVSGIALGIVGSVLIAVSLGAPIVELLLPAAAVSLGGLAIVAFAVGLPARSHLRVHHLLAGLSAS
ncbi:MAG: FtsX-like permease family protein [Acidimicrobiales bacterium]